MLARCEERCEEGLAVALGVGVRADQQDDSCPDGCRGTQCGDRLLEVVARNRSQCSAGAAVLEELRKRCQHACPAPVFAAGPMRETRSARRLASPTLPRTTT